jgi:hypothetical protein
MSQSIILFRQFLFLFCWLSSLQRIWEMFLENSLCFPNVNFTNLANYWDFFNFKFFFGNVLLRSKLSNTNECD